MSVRASRFAKLLVQAIRGDANTVADVPLSVQAVSGQTADLVQYLSSAGVVLAKVNVAGQLVQTAGASLSTPFGLGQIGVARAKYSFAVDGGAQGLITPATNAVLPDNAIIFGGILNPTTALTSLGSATIAAGTSAGSSASSLKTATAVATYSLDALLPVVPVWTAGTAIKLTAAGSMTITVAVADLTAGVLEMTVFYFTAAA